MNKTKSPQDEVKNLFLAFCETSSQDEPITDEVLREEGIDPQQAKQKGTELFRKYQLSRQFAHQANQNKTAFERAKRFVQEQGAKVLGTMPGSDNRKTALHLVLCRDFKELSAQDVETILSDQTTLDLLDNMDNDHDPTKGPSNNRP